jgi:hypothetical protein
MPLSALARHRDKSQHIYYSNLLKTLSSDCSRNAQSTFKKLRINFNIHFKHKSLLDLCFFDPYRHTPSKILHTFLLGFGKYLFEELKHEMTLLVHLNHSSLDWLAAWCDTISVSDCNSSISASNFCRRS